MVVTDFKIDPIFVYGDGYKTCTGDWENIIYPHKVDDKKYHNGFKPLGIVNVDTGRFRTITTFNKGAYSHGQSKKQK